MRGFRRRASGRGAPKSAPSRLLRVQACPRCPEPERLDPRRWFAAAVVIVSVAIPVLDNTMLNVAIPTILREFHTELPSLQWVITGYSLTFATLLIIGGRLGDMYGHRRMFMLGATIFGVGSLLASVSHSVPTLVLGEAIIEGIGASLMIPATLSILSTTFEGPERAIAFAAWGTVAGASVAFGPLVGGFLTTEYSWRWALADQRDRRAAVRASARCCSCIPTSDAARRPRIDVPGAALIAVRIVRARLRPERGRDVRHVPSAAGLLGQRPRALAGDRPISIAPVAIVVAAVILAVFYVYERAKERRNADPLFEFSQLEHLELPLRPADDDGARDGPVRVPARHSRCCCRTASTSPRSVPACTWCRWACCIALGAPLGGRFTRLIGTTRVVRTGLVFEAVGLVVVALMISTHTTLLALLPGLGPVRHRRRASRARSSRT